MNPSSEADPQSRKLLVKRPSEESKSPASSKRIKATLDDLLRASERDDSGPHISRKDASGDHLVLSGGFGACVSGKGAPGKGATKQQNDNLEESAAAAPLPSNKDLDQEDEPNEYLIKFPSNQRGVSPQFSTKQSLMRAMLAKELSFLCGFKHKSIVKLHQISSFPSSEPYVVIDRLIETLEDRFITWRGRSSKNDLRARLLMVHGIASAIEYLHTKKIIFRGLHPSNVGVDPEDKPMLFNFAFAKQLPRGKDNEKDVYHLTVMTGYRNYMAPCNYLGEPYGLSADVYSLSILSWEIVSMRRAFEDISDDTEYATAVVHGRQRPDIPSSWPLLLRNIVRYSWAKNNSTRPTSQVIYAALDQYLFGTTVQSPLIEYIQCLLLSNGTLMDV